MMDIESNYPHVDQNGFSESCRNKRTVLNKVEVVDVDEIIDTRLNKEHKRYYLIKFTSWIPEEELFGLNNLVEQFWKHYDEKECIGPPSDEELSNGSVSPKLYIGDSVLENDKVGSETQSNASFNDDLDELEPRADLDSIEKTTSPEIVGKDTEDSGVANTSDEFPLLNKDCEQYDEIDTDSGNHENRSSSSLDKNTDESDNERYDVPSPTISDENKKEDESSKSEIRLTEDVLSPLNVFVPKKRKLKSLDDIVRKISCNTSLKNNLQFDVRSDEIEKPFIREEKENHHTLNDKNIDDVVNSVSEAIVSQVKSEDLPKVSSVVSLKSNVYWSAGKAYSKRLPKSDSCKELKNKLGEVKCETCMQYIPIAKLSEHEETCKIDRKDGNHDQSTPTDENKGDTTFDDSPPPLVSLNKCSNNSVPESRISPQEKLNNSKIEARPNMSALVDSFDITLNNRPLSSAFSDYSSKPMPSYKYTKYSCTSCELFFHSKDSYIDHMKTKHPEFKPVACDVCSSILVDKLELERHMLQFHSKKCYQCEDCKDTFVEFHEYERHDCRIAGRRKVFRCHICFSTFDEHLTWSRHMEYSHPDARKFHCHVCGKIYFDHVAFKTHIKKEHNMQCVDPEARSNIRGKYPQGSRFHSNNSTPSHKVFRESDPRAFCRLPLPQNMRRKEAIDGRGVMTGFLGEKIPNSFIQTPPALISNSCYRNGEPMFLSPRMRKPGFAPFNFARQQNGKNREQAKSPIKYPDREKPSLLNIMPHQSVMNDTAKMTKECSKCHEKFTSQSLYDIHMQSHGTGSFKCEKCHRIFLQKALYDAHVKMHEQSRSHLCPYCQRSFSMKGNLRRHIRIHTNEAPYECPICFQRFRRSDGLKGHIRRHESMGETAPTDMLPSQASNK